MYSSNDYELDKLYRAEKLRKAQEHQLVASLNKGHSLRLHDRLILVFVLIAVITMITVGTLQA